MPLIKIQTSVAISSEQSTTLLKQLSHQLAEHTGKPEAYVMTAIEGGAMMTFGGTLEPTCYVEIKNIGTMIPEITRSMSSDLCRNIEQLLGVPQSRIYIEFTDARGAMWGWNGSTFG